MPQESADSRSITLHDKTFVIAEKIADGSSASVFALREVQQIPSDSQASLPTPEYVIRLPKLSDETLQHMPDIRDPFAGRAAKNVALFNQCYAGDPRFSGRTAIFMPSTDSARPWKTQEIFPYIPGKSLRELADNTELLTKDFEKIILAIAVAIYQMHERNIVHLDLSLENFHLTEYEGNYSAYIFDFERGGMKGETLTLEKNEKKDFSAPEANNPSHDKKKHIIAQKKMDTFSVGCIIENLLNKTTTLETDEKRWAPLQYWAEQAKNNSPEERSKLRYLMGTVLPIVYPNFLKYLEDFKEKVKEIYSETIEMLAQEHENPRVNLKLSNYFLGIIRIIPFKSGHFPSLLLNRAFLACLKDGQLKSELSLPDDFSSKNLMSALEETHVLEELTPFAPGFFRPRF